MKKKLLVFPLVALFMLPAFAGTSNGREVLSEAGSELFAEEDNPVYIMDMRFLQRLIDEGVDTNGDGLISYAEAEAVIHLDVGIENNCLLTNEMIGDLTGIEAFVNLESLSVQGNLLTHMDISNLTQLEVLNCEVNILNRLDVSKNTALEELNCRWNQISELDLTKNAELRRVNVGYNQLSTLDLSNNSELTHFSCNSRITEAQAYCASFRNTYTHRKPLSSLDLSTNTKLEFLFFCGRSLKNMDISNNTALKSIFLIGTPEEFEVCTWWEGVPPTYLYLQEICCGSISYTDCKSPEISSTELDEISSSIQATSSEDGLIYLVPEGTDAELDRIKEVSVYTADVEANTPVNLSLADLSGGEYWLYAQDNSGNISEKQTLTANTAVGMDDVFESEVRVYPNPAREFVNIELGDAVSASLEIFSLNGQLLYSMDQLHSSQQIDLSGFEKGMYMLSIRSGKSQKIKKLIKE